MRRGRTVDASRPSRAPRPNRAARPSESCKMNIQVEGSRTTAPRARPSRCHGPPGRAYARALNRAHARHAHSAVHTPEHTNSLAQVTLNILCSTLSDMNNMFCFCLYTSRLPAGLIMWDNSQFMFFFIFSSTFILT